MFQLCLTLGFHERDCIDTRLVSLKHVRGNFKEDWHQGKTGEITLLHKLCIKFLIISIIQACLICRFASDGSLFIPVSCILLHCQMINDRKFFRLRCISQTTVWICDAFIFTFVLVVHSCHAISCHAFLHITGSYIVQSCVILFQINITSQNRLFT